jgi:hypothetical protein
LGLRAILTSEPNGYTYEGDRADALACLILEGMFKGNEKALQNNDLIAEKIEEVCNLRKKNIVSSTVLVVIATGEVDWNECTEKYIVEDFVICSNGGPRTSVVKPLDQAVAAITSAFSIEAKSLLELKKVCDSVVYFQDDDKPVYLFSLRGASSGFGSHTFPKEQLKEVGRLYFLLVGDKTLQTVYRLIQNSLETNADPLRSFLSAWSAAEILINKTYSNYGANFIEKVARDKHAEFYKKHVDVIQAERPTLVIKFAAMVTHLSSDTFDYDIAEFKEIKTIRDKIHNGDLISESRLPAKRIRELASRFLQLHLQKAKA